MLFDLLRSVRRPIPVGREVSISESNIRSEAKQTTEEQYKRLAFKKHKPFHVTEQDHSLSFVKAKSSNGIVPPETSPIAKLVRDVIDPKYVGNVPKCALSSKIMVSGPKQYEKRPREKDDTA